MVLERTNRAARKVPSLLSLKRSPGVDSEIGSLSALALLDLFDDSGETREALESNNLRKQVELRDDHYGVAILRDRNQWTTTVGTCLDRRHDSQRLVPTSQRTRIFWVKLGWSSAWNGHVDSPLQREMRKRRFLLWDHDGVLVDTERLFFSATRECLATLGIQLSEDDYLRMMALGRSCFELARQEGIAEYVLRDTKVQRDLRYQELLSCERIELEGVMEALAELKSRYRMAIVSSSKRAHLDLVHRLTGLHGFFEFVISIEDSSRAKPAPEPYLLALERFHAQPEEAVAIEDSSRGLSSARAAGLDCVVLRNRFTATQDFTSAWRILDSVKDLPRVLEG